MGNQESTSKQIFIAVTGAVISGIILFYLNLDGQVKDSVKSDICLISVFNNLSIDQFGQGQVEELAIIDINGLVKKIHLEARLGSISGSIEFELPKEGFFSYEINTTTIWNNMDNLGTLSELSGYGKGEINAKNGDTYQIAIDGQTLGNTKYKVYLKK